MTEDDNSRVVQKVYDSFTAGDLEGLLSTLSDDTAWEQPSIPGVPFFGDRQGPDGVAAFFHGLLEHSEPRGFEVSGIIAHGDKVVGYGRFSFHVKSTGRDYTTSFCHIWTVEDGKITALQDFQDTAAIAAAYAP